MLLHNFDKMNQFFKMSLILMLLSIVIITSDLVCSIQHKYFIIITVTIIFLFNWPTIKRWGGGELLKPQVGGARYMCLVIMLHIIIQVDMNYNWSTPKESGLSTCIRLSSNLKISCMVPGEGRKLIGIKDYI